MSTAEDYHERLSHDSRLTDFSDASSVSRVKHESLKFSLDPINFDPIRFSFLGSSLSPSTGTVAEDNEAELTNALGVDFGSMLSALSFESPVRPASDVPAPKEERKEEEEEEEEEEDMKKEVKKEEPRPYTLLKPVAFSPTYAASPVVASKPDFDFDGPASDSEVDEKAQDHARVEEMGKHQEAAKQAEGDESLDAEAQKASLKALTVPKHPIASMQGAFAESMYEASEKEREEKKKKRLQKKSTPEDAESRRRELLEQDTSEATHASKWNQKAGQQYHELWKLIAQISFGSYLLFDDIANDDGTVLDILQDHVNEVDEFLESTLQDFDHAQEDIDERLRCLKIPMENVAVFDQMLRDRVFRTSIVNGNERIEHVITRTASAMNDALKHVEQGLSATKDFAIWLADPQKFPMLSPDRPDMLRVYDAMKGNAEGWYTAFVSLLTKGNHLGIALVQLGSIIAEMDRRAGEISRNLRFSTDPRSSPTKPASPPQSPPRKPTHAPRPSTTSQNSNKELPKERMTTPAIQTLPAFRYVEERDRTPEPEFQSESESEAEEEDEPEMLQPAVFTLQPRVYSPAASSAAKKQSPSPPSQPQPRQMSPPKPEVEAAPALRERSSLMQRLSMKRKQTPTATTMSMRDISPLTQHSPNMGPPRFSHLARTPQKSPMPESPRQISNTSMRSNAAANSPRQSNRQSPVQGFFPPHRTSNPATVTFQNSTKTTFGVPAGYYPAVDDPVLIPSQLPTPADSQSLNEGYFPMPPTIQSGAASPYINSPRSEQQQHFRPVRADPNSPLQRPWTAAPEVQQQHSLRHSSSNVAFHSHNNNHHHHHHSSNNSNNSNNYKHQPRDPNTLSSSVPRGQSNLNRTTVASNLSVDTTLTNRSGETVGVDSDGKKIKKKRSGFGWLKKAFSLSEEERAAFEERRRRTEGTGGGGGGGGYGVADGYGHGHGQRGHQSARPGTSGYGYNGYNGSGGGYGGEERVRGAPRWVDGRRVR